MTKCLNIAYTVYVTQKACLLFWHYHHRKYSQKPSKLF